MTAVALQHQLQDLMAERALAVIEGLGETRAYMDDLDHEIAAIQFAYVGAAVTEIAVLRAGLDAPLLG